MGDLIQGVGGVKEGVSDAAVSELYMTPEAHAQQVFDRIARGEFYVLGENIRPYVDHDFPFGASDLMHSRAVGLQRLLIDNADACKQRVHWAQWPTLISKSPWVVEHC